MRAENYQLLMQNHAVLTQEQVQEMKHIIEKYPYCQSAYLPLLKYYYTQNHIDFEELLKLTAVYSSDRNQVKKYLMAEVKSAVVESKKEEIKEEQKVELATPEIHDPLLEQLNSQILSEAIGYTLEHNIEAEIEKLPELQKEEKEVEIDNSPKDFYSWLEAPKEVKPKLKYAHLIDKFLAEQPKIVPKKEFFSPVNMARKSVEEDGEIVSETLANLYVQQGHYSKAIKAFEQLSLKFPKKNVYFSARIKEIEELKKHKKQ
ncbi:MAG: hypothetical protein ACO3EE_00120 [Flavobacteriales bacterium]